MIFAQIKVLPLHRIDIATKELVMYSKLLYLVL